MTPRAARTIIEPLLGSAGILIAGLVTIPFAGWLAGVSIDPVAGAKMSVLFFLGRFVWLLALRVMFSRGCR